MSNPDPSGPARDPALFVDGSNGTGPGTSPAPGCAEDLDAAGEGPSSALRRLRRLGRRASLNLVDQGLSALTNVALAFLVARAVDAHSFGAFSVAFLVFTLFIGLERSLVGEPMSIRFSAAEGAEGRRAVDAGVTTVLACAVPGGLVLALVGALAGSTLGDTLVALAVVLPGLLLQDTCRMTFFAQRRPQLAVLNDTVWAVLQFTTMAVLYVGGTTSPWAYVLAWGIPATVAAALGLRQLRAALCFRDVSWWVRAQIDITGYLLLEYLIGAASAQGSILLVGVVGSLSDIGSLRAAQTLLGPLGVVAAALMTFLLPEVARRKEVSARLRSRIAVSVSAGIVLGSLAYTALLLLIPDEAGSALLGETWMGASSVLLPMALASTAASASLGPAVIIYAMGQARRTFRLHAFEAPLIVLCMAGGAQLAGTPGAAWGMAVSMSVMIPLWFWQLRKLLARTGMAEAGERS